jgi:purine-binding chemotaxis protein CheW
MPLPHVVEIMRPLPLQAIAGTPPFVTGAAVIRGVPTPVIDCGALLGEHTPPAPTRWATIRCKGRVAALAFEQVLGIHPLAAVDDLPPLLRGSDAVTAIASVDAELVLVLASARLVPDSLWQSLDNQAATP